MKTQGLLLFGDIQGINKMIVYTKKEPLWLGKLNIEAFEDKQFLRIITFFVFHSPVDNLSARQICLSEYGWNTPWRKPYYLNKQLKQAASNYELLFSSATFKKMDEALTKADLISSFPSNIAKERICIYDCKNNQFMSVFFHIRNAFAHGRFDFRTLNDEEYYILEDVQKDKGDLKVSARMILKKRTLLNWIDIFERGEKEYKKHEEIYI
ncbi:MAG: hypothetical protein E7372_01615 [Clostridiales bacterium]|nr:hypothetical protein [Clostridiales bacterium]